MVKKDIKVLNIKLDKNIFERVERFRFKRMFDSKTAAIEFLLDYALKVNPKREAARLDAWVQDHDSV